MTLVPGSTLNGKYRVIDRLGSGGMGTVWRGHDLDLDREVAIKVMRDASCDAESLERFRREAMLAARLDHPGITLVHDFDGHEGQFFIVMQMLTGRDLRATLECHPGGLPVPMAVDLAVQAAEALSAAHGHGVVHRDLKPANLFIVAGDKLKICDFGVAKAVDGTTTITKPGHVIGTPAYMPPEQWKGERVDARSDLYSLGCVLYEMLAGHPPFAPGESLPALMHQHLQVRPGPPRGDHYIPRALSALVLRLLAKDPVDRPATAASLATDLKAISLAPGAEAEQAQLAETARRKEIRRRPVRAAGLMAGIAAWILLLTTFAETIGTAFFNWENMRWLLLLIPGVIGAFFTAVMILDANLLDWTDWKGNTSTLRAVGR